MKQLILFFLLAYGISWLIWSPLWLPAWGVRGLPVLTFHHALGGLGPMLAALLSTALFERREGVTAMLRSMFSWRPVIWIGIALFSPFVLSLGTALIQLTISGQIPAMSGLGKSREFPELGIVGFFAYNLLFFGWGEETGWRGYALPRFQQKFNALASSLLLTVFWALWHWPLFFYRPGYTGMDIGGIAGWVFSLLTGSILLSWLFNSARGSILVCAIFHTTVDIAFTSDFTGPGMVQYTGMLITFWGIATVLIFKWKNLARAARVVKLSP